MAAGQVQADEIRVKVRGGVVWQAMALDVASHLWLGGAVSRTRDGARVTRLLERVRACLATRALLLCVDGFVAYVGAARSTFRESVHTAKRGRPRLALPEGFLLAQVVKSHQGRRLAEVMRRVVVGTEEAVARVSALARGGTQINTAYIERLNATFRARLSPLVRRGRGIAHGTALVESGMWLVGCAYHVCWTHDSLRLRAIGGRKWLERTPAMVAGLTDHVWSMEEVLRSPIPPADPVPVGARRCPCPVPAPDARAGTRPLSPSRPRGRGLRTPRQGGSHDHSSLWLYPRPLLSGLDGNP